MSLRAKVTICFVAAAILPLLGFQLLSRSRATALLEQQAQARLANLARLFASELDNHLAPLVADAQAMAADINKTAPSDADRILAKAIARHPEYIRAYVWQSHAATDDHGTNVGQEGVSDPRGRPHVSPEPHVSLDPSPVDGQTVVSVRVPQADTKKSGLLVLEINRSEINDLLVSHAQGWWHGAMWMALVDRNNKVVASTRPEMFIPGASFAAETAPPAAAPYYETSAELALAPWRLHIFEDKRATLAPLFQIEKAFLQLGAFAVGAAILFAAFLSRGFSRRFAAISAAIKTIATSGYGAPIPQTGSRDEVGMILTRLEELRHNIKVSEDSLLTALLQAQAAARTKSEFVASMSHELRTPLNHIMGYTDLLLDGAFGDLNAEQADSLRRVLQSSKALLDLIQGTLDLMNIEANRLPLQPVEVDLPSLLRQLRFETEEFQQKPELEVRWGIAPDLPVIRTDPAKLKVILKNLLANAIKFTAQGQVKVTAEAHNDGIEIAVSDTGIGIAPQALPIIFEPFRQADGSTTRRYGGAGLGLHLVKRLTEMLGARIAVESQVGCGSTFRVWLPLRRDPGQSALAA